MNRGLIPSRSELEQRASAGDLVTLSEELRAALIEDNRARPEHKRHQALLTALHHPQARFVVTGQQLGVYGGPLLTLYKALHAIKLAQLLTVPGGPPVLPLFWLQGEDHDIEEIASITIPAPGVAGNGASTAELLKTVAFDLDRWVGNERRLSVAGLKLPSETAALSTELIAQLPTLEGSSWLAPAVSVAYQPGTTVLDAFRELFDALLGDEAMLYLNPQLPAVRRGAIALNQLALSRYLEIGALLESVKDAAQVHVRARSPLFFFHPTGASGPRYRVESVGDDRFRAVGSSAEFTTAELEAAISAANGSISTSALLRPLIQDSLLPSICYIGGQAELRYFEQVALIASLVNAPTPRILPRARFVLLDARAARLQKQLGIAVNELLQPLEAIQRSVTDRELGETSEAIFSRMRAQLDAALFAPSERFKRIDGEAEQLLRRTQDKIARAVDGLEERIARSSVAAFARDDGRLRRLHAQLRPNDQPQERVLAAVWYAAQYGPRFATALLTRLDPFAVDDREVIVELSEL